MLPLGCFPLWGREGVILQAAAENKRIETKEGFQQNLFFNNFLWDTKKNRIRMMLTYFYGCPGAFFKVPDPTGYRPENGHGFFSLVEVT